MGQPDVADELGDRVVHGGNRRLLGVSLDVKDTFLDGLGRSLLVLCYAMLVHPLLGFPLALHLVLEPSRFVMYPSPTKQERRMALEERCWAMYEKRLALSGRKI